MTKNTKIFLIAAAAIVAFAVVAPMLGIDLGVPGDLLNIAGER